MNQRKDLSLAHVGLVTCCASLVLGLWFGIVLCIGSSLIEPAKESMEPVWRQIDGIKDRAEQHPLEFQGTLIYIAQPSLSTRIEQRKLSN